MSIDADPDAATASEDVETLARQLGDAITELPEYRRFQDAKSEVEDHPEAQEKIAAVEDLRQEFALARQIGEASQEDLRKLQRAQQELHSMPVMDEYLEAQNDLDARLEALNEAISEPLDVDFGEQAGGCCADD